MRRARFGVISLFVAGLAACEPTQVNAPPQPKPVEVALPAEPSASASAGPDLAPVAEPADIVGIGRWRSPMATVSNLASCAGVAPVIVEVNARMGVDMLLRRFIRGGDTRKLAALVSLDAPVDVVAVLDPDLRPRPPQAAIALGLTSLDSAKVALGAEGSGPEIAPGVWKVKGVRGAACGVAASAGATPARLVCAEREKALEALAPYLARTLPGVDLGGPDMHLEARVAVLEERYGDSLRKLLRALPGALSTEYGIGDARFDRLLFETGTDVQEDAGKLLADVRRLTAEVRTERSGACLRAKVDADLSGRTSWVAQALTDRLDRSGPPPAIYWRQPRDSDAALYGRGVDAARYAGVLGRLRDLLDAALATEGFAAADRKKITELLALPHGKDTSTVFSMGAVSAPLPAAGTKDMERKVVEAGFAGVMGWTLLGVDEGPAVLDKQLKAMVDAYRSAGVQANLKKSLGSDAKHLPIVKSGAAPASLGAGSKAIEITIPSLEVPPPPGGRTGKPQTMSLTVHLLMMPDGDSTWLAIGAVKDELVKHLAVVKASAGDKGQLASRSDLDPLRSGKQMFGGFVSAAPAAQRISSHFTVLGVLEPAWFGSEVPVVTRALNGLPNGGRTPIFVTADGAAAPDATKLTLAIDVQQGTFEDARSLAVSAYSFFSRVGILP